MSHCNANKDGRSFFFFFTVLYADGVLSGATATQTGLRIYGAVLHMNDTVNCLPCHPVRSVKAFQLFQTVCKVGRDGV